MSDQENIECPVTKWYYKRMGLLTLMLCAFTLWFVYDAKIGYPKKNVIHDKKVKLEEAQTEFKSWKDQNEGDDLSGWRTIAEEKDYPLQENGEPRTWASFAKDNNLPQEPKEMAPSDIRQQWQFAGLFGLGALGVALTTFLNRNKRISADQDSYTDPSGRVVPFDAIVEIDKRKWDNKGLAYLRYKSGDGTEKATLDDLKYKGTDKILDRILSTYQGDLIETVIEEDDDEEDDDE